MDNVTVVSPGILITGTVTGTGPIAVGGRVDGRIAVAGEVQVTQKGRLVADVAADTVVVAGSIKGNIKAVSAVALGPGAQVEGAIESKHVDVDPQARLKGRLVMPLTLPRGLKVPSGSNTKSW